MLTNTSDVDFIIPLLKQENNSIKKIAYSGTHGTGKTTSCFNLATQCKLNCHSKSIHLLTEVASESPFKINKETTVESQMWIFVNQISRELENSLRYKILISDRTIVDNIAYTMVAGFKDLAKNQYEFAKSFISTYDYIFVKKNANNDFHYEDGIRDSKDSQYRQDVEDALLNIYIKLESYMVARNRIIFI
jgi:hypothetical protein